VGQADRFLSKISSPRQYRSLPIGSFDSNLCCDLNQKSVHGGGQKPQIPGSLLGIALVLLATDHYNTSLVV